MRPFLEGNGFSTKGRILQVNPQSAANWISGYVAHPQAPLQPDHPQTGKFDELFTFVRSNKNQVIILNITDWDTRSFLGFDVVVEPTQEDLLTAPIAVLAPSGTLAMGLSSTLSPSDE